MLVALLGVPWQRVDASATAATQAAAERLAVAIAQRDGDALMALLAADVALKERTAVLATSRAEAHAWLSACLAADLWLDAQTLRVEGDTATWHFTSAPACYWRARSSAPATAILPASPAGQVGRVGPDTTPEAGSRAAALIQAQAATVPPAHGVAQITVRGGEIAIVSLSFSPDWEFRLIAAQAAQMQTVYAQATQTARATATATAMLEAQATRTAAYSLPYPPDTQWRGTPSLAPWLLAIGLCLCFTLVAGAIDTRSTRDSA